MTGDSRCKEGEWTERIETPEALDGGISGTEHTRSIASKPSQCIITSLREHRENERLAADFSPLSLPPGHIFSEKHPYFDVMMTNARPSEERTSNSGLTS